MKTKFVVERDIMAGSLRETTLSGYGKYVVEIRAQAGWRATNIANRCGADSIAIGTTHEAQTGDMLGLQLSFPDGRHVALNDLEQLASIYEMATGAMRRELCNAYAAAQDIKENFIEQSSQGASKKICA